MSRKKKRLLSQFLHPLFGTSLRGGKKKLSLEASFHLLSSPPDQLRTIEQLELILPMRSLTQTPKRKVSLSCKLWGDLNGLQNPFNQHFREQNQYENKLNKVFSCLNYLHSGFQWRKWEFPKGRAGERMEGGCSCGCQGAAVSPGLQCHEYPVPCDNGTSWGCQRSVYPCHAPLTPCPWEYPSSSHRNTHTVQTPAWLTADLWLQICHKRLQV